MRAEGAPRDQADTSPSTRDPEPEAPRETAPGPEAPPLSTGQKRPEPDYDGRPEPPDDGENAATWALRVVLFPAYLVTEYLVRRPLGWATVAAERANLVHTLVDFFTFGPDRNAALIPTALIDFGFKPSVGLYLFWDDAFADGHGLRINAATWGPSWLRLSITNQYEFAPGSHLGLRLQGWRRPDWLFHGLGPRSQSEHEARYSRTDLNAVLRLDTELWRSSHLSAHAGIHSETFEDESCCDAPSVGTLVERGAYALPPGFESGIRTYRHGLELSLDSRKPRPAPGSGVRFVARGEQNFRLHGDAPDQWLRYSGTLGAYWDVRDQNRVVGLSVSAGFADPIGGTQAIPFTRQVVLGGDTALRGFLEGRLIGRSALVGRLEYTWPIWVLVDGSFGVEAGNVFSEHLSDFSPELSRLSFTFGMRAHGRRDYPFEALIGLGTAPLDEGTEIESIRIVIGANNGI